MRTFLLHTGASWVRETPRGGRSCGLSLLEVVIAMGILMTTTLGTSLLLIPIARQSRISRETEVANAEAQKVLEQFQATPFNEIVLAYPPGVDVPVNDLHDGNLNVSYADPDADPLEIRVSLTWDSPELGSMELVFDTVRTE